jgi:hypothetical protein
LSPSPLYHYLYVLDVISKFMLIVIITLLLSLAVAFLRRFCHICHPVFTSFDFTTTVFFTEQGRQPCVQPPTRRTRSLYLCHPVTGWPSYTPQAPGSLFISFYDSQGYGGGILTRLHTVLNIYSAKYKCHYYAYNLASCQARVLKLLA